MEPFLENKEKRLGRLSFVLALNHLEGGKQENLSKL